MFNHTRNSEVFADHLTVTLNSKSKIKLYNFVSMLHHGMIEIKELKQKN